MSAAAAGILGALAGLGVILVITGLRRGGAPQPSPRASQIASRVRQEATMPRVTATLLTAATAAAVTRWPAGTVLAGLAAWFLPRAMGPDREHARALERIEAIASWTEMLRDTISAAAGLEQAILAVEPVAPGPVREHVVLLAARIRRGERLPAALRAFAAEAADPTADLVIAALLLGAEQQARDLAQLLGSLADSAANGAAELGEAARSFAAEVRAGMLQRELELNRELGLDGSVLAAPGPDGAPVLRGRAQRVRPGRNRVELPAPVHHTSDITPYIAPNDRNEDH